MSTHLSEETFLTGVLSSPEVLDFFYGTRDFRFDLYFCRFVPCKVPIRHNHAVFIRVSDPDPEADSPGSVSFCRIRIPIHKTFEIVLFT